MKVVSDTPAEVFWCGAGESAEQGFSNIVVFDLKIVWPKPSQAIGPGLKVGHNLYGSWIQEPEGPFRSGQAYVITTCRNPADPLVVSLYVDLNGTGIQYAFHFK